MATSQLYSHLRLLPKRQLFSHRFLSLRHASNQPKQKTPYREPTPPQLLRFALTGTTHPVKPDAQRTDLDRHLQDLFLEEWPFNTPSPLWGSSIQKEKLFNPKVLLKDLKRQARSIRHVQTFLERNVNGAESGALLQTEDCKLLAQMLERCQLHSPHEEILSAINGLIERLERLNAPVSSGLYVLGMLYASRCLSRPALEYHVEGYHRKSSEKLKPEASVLLVNAIVSSLKIAQAKDPNYDISVILDLVFGESDSSQSSYNLHDILSWAGPEGSVESIEQYVSLLSMRQDDASLPKVWDRILLMISSNSSFHTFQSAYDFIVAMVDTTKLENAIPFLKQISDRAGNALPGISNFWKLSSLLADPSVGKVLPELAGKEEYLSIVDNQLGHLERRLGIEWQPEKSLHTSISDPLCIATGQSLITIDGESVGLESRKRLVAEIEALGCSKSLSDLGRIASLLDEHEGSEIPVMIPNSRDTSRELVWFPHRSPLEFSNSLIPAPTDVSMSWSPSTLGLLRVRFDNDGTPITNNEHSLHLMQLGYLGIRESQGPAGFDLDLHGSWRESGHIVALDRVSGRFLIVFVGKGLGVINPGLQQQPLPPLPPLGLGVITMIAPFAVPNDLTSGISMSSWTNNNARYHFDVDPSTDLVA